MTRLEYNLDNFIKPYVDPATSEVKKLTDLQLAVEGLHLSAKRAQTGENSPAHTVYGLLLISLNLEAKRRGYVPDSSLPSYTSALTLVVEKLYLNSCSICASTIGLGDQGVLYYPGDYRDRAYVICGSSCLNEAYADGIADEDLEYLIEHPLQRLG